MKTCNSEETGTQQLIFPPNSRPSNFEEGIEVGRDQERQRLTAYFHDQLAPDLMALAFSIEGIRIELESEKHPAEAKLKEHPRSCVQNASTDTREHTKSSRGSAKSFLRKAILCLKGKDIIEPASRRAALSIH